MAKQNTTKNSGSKRQVRRKILVTEARVGDVVSLREDGVYSEVEYVCKLDVRGAKLVELRTSKLVITTPRDYTIFKMEVA